MSTSSSFSWFKRFLDQLPSKILWVLLAILVVISLILSVVWLLAVVIWPNQALILNEQSLKDYATSDKVRIRWPKVLLAGAQDVQVEVTCLSVNQYPIDLQFSLNSNAEYLDWVLEENLERTVRVSCTPTSPRTQWVTLRYTRILPWRLALSLPRATFKVEMIGRSVEKTFQLQVEGQGRWLIRQIGISEVSQRSPIILFLGLVAAGVGSLYKEYWRRKEEKEAQHKQYEARQQPNRLLEKFAKGEIEEARTEFQKADRVLWDEADRKRLEGLLALADGQLLDEQYYETLLKSHPPQVARALLHSVDRDKNNPIIQRWLRLFPLDAVPSLADQLQGKIQELGPLQDVEWPLEPQGQAESKILGFENPWPCPVLHAEQELGRLFGSRGIFYEASFFKQLQQGAYPGRWRCVSAAQGRGATALAYGLVHRADSQTWAVRSTVVFMKGLCKELAQQLLLYCSHNPLRLAELSAAEQRLLVEVLVSCLPKTAIVAELDQRLQQPEPQEKTEKDRCKSGKVQLRWMKQILNATVGELDEVDWLRHYLLGLRCLGFHRFHLVFDRSHNPIGDWRRLDALCENFCGSDWAVTWIGSEQICPFGEVIEFAWTQEEMVELFKERWQVLNPENPHTDFIENLALQRLVQFAQGSPLYLAELWQKICCGLEQLPIGEKWVEEKIGDDSN